MIVDDVATLADGDWIVPAATAAVTGVADTTGTAFPLPRGCINTFELLLLL